MDWICLTVPRCEFVSAWCPVHSLLTHRVPGIDSGFTTTLTRINSYPIPGAFLPHTQCFWDRLQIHHNPDQDQTLTEDKWCESVCDVCVHGALWETRIQFWVYSRLTHSVPDIDSGFTSTLPWLKLILKINELREHDSWRSVWMCVHGALWETRIPFRVYSCLMQKFDLPQPCFESNFYWR